jgi:hypothetical protein
MMETKNLKLSLTRFKVSCLERAYLGLRFIRCLLVQAQDDVVSDHFLVSEEGVKVLDNRE